MDAEILSITPDRKNPFKVEFDDQSWEKYEEHLKPLGLSILLNTCNISTEERYTNFFNHLVCESTRVQTETEAASAVPAVSAPLTDSCHGSAGLDVTIALPPPAPKCQSAAAPVNVNSRFFAFERYQSQHGT